VPRKNVTIERAQQLAESRSGKCLSITCERSAAKLLWQCSEGHQWQASFNNIQRGKWCPFCRGFYRTIEDMQSLARRNGGRCVSKAFVTMATKLRWRCSAGHEWDAIPLSIKRGSWCPVCAGHIPLNIRDLKQMAEERGGKCLSEHYVNSSSKLRWKCAKGHEWEAVAASVKAGTWCPVCVGRGKTIEDMQQLANLKGGRCLSATFAGINNKLRWQCAQGHIWQAIPKNIQKGHWCQSCANSQPRKYSLADFERIARCRGGRCLSTEFKSVRNKLLWECAKGHRWEAIPYPIKMGVWCPFCVGRHKTIADMQEMAKKHGGRCLSRSYLGKEKKLLWECSLGHRWEAVPHSIGMGTWCPVCGGTQKRTIEEMKQMAVERGGKCLSKEYVNTVIGPHESCHCW